MDQTYKRIRLEKTAVDMWDLCYYINPDEPSRRDKLVAQAAIATLSELVHQVTECQKGLFHEAHLPKLMETDGIKELGLIRSEMIRLSGRLLKLTRSPEMWK